MELTDIKKEENINDDTPDTDTDYYENNYNQSSKKPSTSASNYPKELNDTDEFKTIKDIDNVIIKYLVSIQKSTFLTIFYKNFT